MLNSSGSWSVHISSINVIFYNGLSCLVLRVASSLDAFRTYPSVRSCPACFITTGTPEAPEHRSSRTRCSFHSDNNAPSRYHTNCLTYFLNTYAFVLCGLYLHPIFFRQEISVLMFKEHSQIFHMSAWVRFSCAFFSLRT